MIGVSLPFGWLLNGQGLDVSREELLQQLKRQGVRSIELRTVRANTPSDDVETVARMLWDKGFLVSIHGEVKTAQTAADDVFHPLQKLLANLGQPKLNVTVHPINGDNVAMLNRLADCIERHAPNVMIALENNRLLPDKTEGDCAQFVLDAVQLVDRPCIGICFDFGHYLYYLRKNCPDAPDLLPSEAFRRRVIHTHIHSLNGLMTHFPLSETDMAFKEIIGQLSIEYFGLYNLELDFPRFRELYQPQSALLDSVGLLQQAEADSKK